MDKKNKDYSEEHFKKFTNRECEYFPCHKTSHPEDFNCLFCYCPLYALGDQCGGNYIYNEDIKDCSQCFIPHSKGGYAYITKKFHEISKLASANRKSEDETEPSSSLRKARVRIL